jgi:hypothetical protein
MKFRFYSAALLLSVIACNAAAEEWPKLVSTDDGAALYVKPGSGRVEIDANNISVFSVDAKHINGDSIVLMQLSVTVDDCAKEKGSMRTTEVGSSQGGSLPFIFGSGTAASIAAEMLCRAGFYATK